MSSTLSDAAYKAAEEMSLSEFTSLKIKYKQDFIICRNVIMADGKTQFILMVLSKLPESDDIERYYDQLLDWAVDNSRADLEKLSSL